MFFSFSSDENIDVCSGRRGRGKANTVFTEGATVCREISLTTVDLKSPPTFPRAFFTRYVWPARIITNHFKGFSYKTGEIGL